MPNEGSRFLAEVRDRSRWLVARCATHQPSARFAATEVKVGRGSPWAAPLEWTISPYLPTEILLTGDAISTKRAYEIGLVNRVVPEERLVDESQTLAETIAANAPLSVLAAKRAVRLVAVVPLSEAFDERERIWEPVYLSDDAKEGPWAFRDLRAPNWTGR